MAKPIAILMRFLQLVFLAISVLICVVLLRALLLRQLPPESDICSPSEDDFIALNDAAIKRFQAAIRFRTVSRAMHDYDREQLRLLSDHIVDSEYYFWFLASILLSLSSNHLSHLVRSELLFSFTVQRTLYETLYSYYQIHVHRCLIQCF